MERFRNGTLEYFGGKEVKSVVWEYLIKKSYMQICHYIVAEESQYCGTWQLIKEKRELEIKRLKKKKENYVANGISNTIGYLLDWPCLL